MFGMGSLIVHEIDVKFEKYEKVKGLLLSKTNAQVQSVKLIATYVMRREIARIYVTQFLKQK